MSALPSGAAPNLVLRTSVAWEGLARPVQVVHTGVRVPVTHVDRRHLPAAPAGIPIVDVQDESSEAK